MIFLAPCLKKIPLWKTFFKRYFRVAGFGVLGDYSPDSYEGKKLKKNGSTCGWSLMLVISPAAAGHEYSKNFVINSASWPRECVECTGYI